MIVRFKDNDPEFGIKKGDIFFAKRYWLDPMEKVTLIKRLPDGFEPGCNAYLCQVDILSPNKSQILGKIK